MSNLKVPDVSFQKVKFEQCKMLGIHFHASNPFLLEFIFQGCQLDYCSFYNLKIKKSKFINSRLIETDFTQADLTASDFQGSDLSGATFDLTNAEKVDFRNALHYSIDPERNRIKGARFDLDGLPGLLGKYAIKIG
ncbi:pentapeptide repeat-containing protein [Algoriphagus sp. D3-2-R+10]|uniref:pentapeptide repeat-containing protein n=1 Tax=Algoriphagus aurantiacus TaxID=3103948 RepID=UPI003A5D0AA9